MTYPKEDLKIACFRIYFSDTDLTAPVSG